MSTSASISSPSPSATVPLPPISPSPFTAQNEKKNFPATNQKTMNENEKDNFDFDFDSEADTESESENEMEMEIDVETETAPLILPPPPPPPPTASASAAKSMSESDHLSARANVPIPSSSSPISLPSSLSSVSSASSESISFPDPLIQIGSHVLFAADLSLLVNGFVFGLLHQFDINLGSQEKLRNIFYFSLLNSFGIIIYFGYHYFNEFIVGNNKSISNASSVLFIPLLAAMKFQSSFLTFTLWVTPLFIMGEAICMLLSHQSRRHQRETLPHSQTLSAQYLRDSHLTQMVMKSAGIAMIFFAMFLEFENIKKTVEPMTEKIVEQLKRIENLLS